MKRDDNKTPKTPSQERRPEDSQAPFTLSFEASQQGPDPKRHARKCAICRHPDREAIDEAFIHWTSPDDIENDHNLPPSRSALYRHAHATGLYARRRRNLRYALEQLIEHADRAVVSGDCIIRAIRAYSRVTSDGHWIDPPNRVVV
ncbi:MAG: hypothetical protein WBL70_19070, partial [Candidatus Acidiferrales bacterium]